MLDRPFALFRLTVNSGTSSSRDGLGIACELGGDVFGEGFGRHAAKAIAYLYGPDGAGSDQAVHQRSSDAHADGRLFDG
jgi:hypothetical protein